MFVGSRPFQPEDFSELANLGCTGTAIGGFGRHTRITPDGMPVFDDRVGVTFKVDATFLNLSLYI